MVKTIKPNILSFSSLFIEAFFGENRLGIATGFPWEHNGSQYLITNWHVVTGLHPETGQPLDQNGATPDLLKVWFHLAENLGQWDCCDIPLFNNQNRPLWIEHESLRSKVDVVGIKLNLSSKFRVFPINNVSFTDFRVEISQDVYIVGFPRGITGAGKFPIWKRGSVASEPEIDLDHLPKILIDSMTREGMSGSPVFVQYVGYHGDDPENPKGSDWFGMARKFLGVYSGRLPGQDEFEAHLGIVWKESIIDQIITAGVRPD
jgi:hypothetical protein